MKKLILKTFILLIINSNAIFGQYITVSGGNTIKCAGQAVTLTYHKSTGLLGTNTSTRWWNIANPCGAGLAPFTIGNPITVYPTTTTTYWAWDYTGTACVEIASITITVNPLPNVTANTSSSVICNGGSVTLSGGGASTYTWSNGIFNGVAFNPTTTNTYSVTGTDTNGCQNSATKTITVNPLPNVTANTSSSVICNGGSVTLSGGGASTYTWSNGISNGVAFNPTTSNTYSVTGTDVNGCQNNDTITVVVNTCTNIHFSSNSTNYFINIFPNPANEYITLQINSTVEKNISIHLYELLGNEIKNENRSLVIGENKIELNLPELNSGIYFLKVDNQIRKIQIQ